MEQKINIITAQLCGCNNCMAIMIDENPKYVQELAIDQSLLVDMVFINENGDTAPEDEHWACPNCLTDGHLIDIVSEEQLKIFLPAVKQPLVLTPFDINSIDNVKVFFSYLMHDLNLNFHPDTPFENYVSNDNGQPLFTEEQAGQLDTTLERCFVICQTYNRDIYEVANEVFVGGRFVDLLKESQALLKRIVKVLNQIPNKRVYKDSTYELCSAIDDLLPKFNSIPGVELKD